MPQQFVYFPSGRGPRVRDCCHGCSTGDFVGDVVMAYDPESGVVHLICERCYRRLQNAAARANREAAMRERTARLLDKAVLACGCGD